MSLTKEYVEHCRKAIKRIQDEGLPYRTILPMPSTPVAPPKKPFNDDIALINLEYYSPDVEAVFFSDNKYLPQIISKTTGDHHILGLFTNLESAKNMIREYHK